MRASQEEGGSSPGASPVWSCFEVGGVVCPSAKLICLSPPLTGPSPLPPSFIPSWASRQRCEVCPGEEPALKLGIERRAFFKDFAGPFFFFSMKYKDVQFFWFQFSIGEFYNLVIKISDRL